MDNPRTPHNCIPDFCVTCQESVDDSSVLHILEKHLNDMRTCPFCREAFSSLQQLENHLSQHTALKIRPSICLGCRRKFVSLEGRILHQCSNNLICKTCNAIFSTEAKLSDHQDTQHKDKLTVDSVKELPSKDNNSVTDLEEGESSDGYFTAKNNVLHRFIIFYLFQWACLPNL
jgi:hypothetical protein